MAKAVVLLSGGLDSATALAVARKAGGAVHALAVDYGQRHRVELQLARVQAAEQGAADFRVVAVDLRAIGGSALTAEIAVPTDRDERSIGDGIPVTYVPARNTVLLSLALGYAEVIGAWDIYVGVNAVDYSGYPDCRPEYIAQFERLANLATKAAVEGHGRFQIHAPLLKLTKAEIIRLGTEMGVNYCNTSSCYAPDETGRACGRCDSCIIRRNGFRDAGVADPTRYVNDALD